MQTRRTITNGAKKTTAGAGDGGGGGGGGGAAVVTSLTNAISAYVPIIAELGVQPIPGSALFGADMKNREPPETASKFFLTARQRMAAVTLGRIREGCKTSWSGSVSAGSSIPPKSEKRSSVNRNRNHKRFICMAFHT